MSSRPVRVVLVDDSTVVRAGLRTLLGLDQSLELVGEAGDGDEALSVVRDQAPDVVLLDVRMPHRDGASVVKELSTLAKVVMLTFTDEEAVIRRATQDGAVGYLVHGTFDATYLSHMVHSAARGIGTFSAPAVKALRENPSPDRPTNVGPRHGLSARQVEVMNLIAEGKTNQEIAKELFLAEKTVKNHINQIFAALGVSNRAHAIIQWLKLE